jgi:hypothetical protein
VNPDDLRALLDATIPEGGTDADTPFSDAEIAALLAASTTLEGAAAAGWRLRAARAQSEFDGLSRFSLDQQSFSFETLKERREHALAMASLYQEHGGGQIMPFAGGLTLGDKRAQEQDTGRVRPIFTRTTLHAGV